MERVDIYSFTPEQEKGLAHLLKGSAATLDPELHVFIRLEGDVK